MNDSFFNSTDAEKAFIKVAGTGVNGKIYCLGSGDGRPLKYYIDTIVSVLNPTYEPNYGAIPYTDSSIKYLVADITD